MRNTRQLLSYFLMTATLTLFARTSAAAISFEGCRSGYAAIREIFRSNRLVEPSGPDLILPEVRRWLTTQKNYLAGTVSTQSVGDVLTVAGTEVKVVARLGHGSEGDVYLVETSQGLRTLKTFFSADRMDPHLRELKSEFPLPSPKIFERDEKTGHVLMEYVEGASVDHIMGRWREMGLTEKRKNEILEHWAREQVRIRNSGKWPPDGFNVIYSFPSDSFYRVDPL